MRTLDEVRHLYNTKIPSTRSGPLYNAFSYPTKVDPEVIAILIASHTAVGGTVLDPFGGSGTTAIAAKLCDSPTKRMKELAEVLSAPIEWGPRHAVVYELSPLGALVGDVMANPPDSEKFQAAAHRMISDVAERCSGLYRAVDPTGQIGDLRYAIWSEIVCCVHCGSKEALYDVAVRRGPASFSSKFTCPECCELNSAADCDRLMETYRDPLTDTVRERRARRLVRVYGRTNKKTWDRAPLDSDDVDPSVINGVVADTAPRTRIRWGDLHRSGYHTGFDFHYDFYTPRNLRVMAEFFSAIDAESDPHLRRALRVLLLSYNASHSTLLSRVVAKKAMPDLVVTGAQSGVLYVSGLPVEKNIITGIERKLRTFSAAFDLVADSSSTATVLCGSATNLEVGDSTIDYVFTDPPFGDYIPYAEINQINEAWLGSFTDISAEAVVSKSQNKTVLDYQSLLKEAFSEVARVMRPTALSTVVFHASKPAIWNAIGDAFQSSGLEARASSVLDKGQVSFKQVVSAGGTKGDALFLLSQAETEASTDSAATPVSLDLSYWRGRHPDEDMKHLWTSYVAAHIEQGKQVALTSQEFYALLYQSDTP